MFKNDFKGFANELEQDIFKATVESIKEEAMATLTEEEASLIKIEVIGKDIESLSLKIDGPDDLVTKIEAALSVSE